MRVNQVFRALVLSLALALTARADRDVAYWTAQLASADPAARAAAARGLGLTGSQADDAVPHLVGVLTDDVPDVRQAAVEALDAIGRPADVAAKPLAKLLDVETSADVRRAAQKALEHMGSRAHPAVPELVAALESPHSGGRRAAADVLGEVGVLTPQVESALVRRMVADEETRVRTAARSALATLGRELEDVAPELVAALDDQSALVRRNAAGWLRKLEAAPEGSVDDLVRLLASDPDPDVRNAAANALAAFGPASGASPLLQRVLRDGSPPARESAAEVLGNAGAGGPRELVALAEASLRDEELAVRLSARGALVKLARTVAGAVDELMRLGERPDLQPDVRAACVDAVGRLGEGAAPALARMVVALHEGPEDVREAAAKSLGRIGAEAVEAIPALKQAESWDRSQAVRDAAGRSARSIRDAAIEKGRAEAPAPPEVARPR